MKKTIIICDSEAEILKGVKRKANIGEYVAIVHPNCLCHINYELGDIVHITEEIETGNVKGVNQKDGVKTGCIYEKEYVVLENYQPKSEPEQQKEQYYNGKVVCINSKSINTTTGKIYEVVDGVMTFDDNTYNTTTRYTSFEDLNKKCFSDFLEIVE